jgi:hypothetical protein
MAEFKMARAKKETDFYHSVTGTVIEVRHEIPTASQIEAAVAKDWNEPKPCWYVDVLFKQKGINSILNLPYYENKPSFIAGRQYNFDLRYAVVKVTVTDAVEVKPSIPAGASAPASSTK